jgi:membrane dipeptidase
LGGPKTSASARYLDGIDAMPKGMKGIEDMEQIYEILLRRNLTENIARDIFYNNLSPVIKTACG